ncbi:hypothetical protein [Affinirhizobium pseudoryzae]|uniref:hypothetical protein n=1 Tax=Allorhizobium pseudoryzae TaxID=379684 RepID=UPI0013EAC232|nr:hypothetical protein [Allorhizobium pseudoryzae]
MIGRNRLFLVPVALISVVVGTVAIESLLHAGSAQELRQLRNIALLQSADRTDEILAARQSTGQLIEACESTAIDAAIELDVAYADRFAPQSDRDAWQKALAELASHARLALACQPTNGLIWARLAFAEWFLGRPGEEQARILEYSELYAPAELVSLNARLHHWSRLSPYVLQRAETSYERDLLTFLLWFPSTAAAQMWQTFSEREKQFAARLTPAVPEERLRQLAAKGVIPVISQGSGSDELRPSRD